jgi:hypothetical protein
MVLTIVLLTIVFPHSCSCIAHDYLTSDSMVLTIPYNPYITPHKYLF